MADFNIRTDAVDVEQIMRQIRARIQEKRGVDYTEQQIQELANVKLERFLDPKGVRSDLVEQFKSAAIGSWSRSSPSSQYAVDANDLYGSAPWPRPFDTPSMFRPDPEAPAAISNRLIQVLHKQTEINTCLRRAVLFPSRENPAARRRLTPCTTSSFTTSCSS